MTGRDPWIFLAMRLTLSPKSSPPPCCAKTETQRARRGVPLPTTLPTPPPPTPTPLLLLRPAGVRAGHRDRDKLTPPLHWPRWSIRARFEANGEESDRSRLATAFSFRGRDPLGFDEF